LFVPLIKIREEKYSSRKLFTRTIPYQSLGTTYVYRRLWTTYRFLNFGTELPFYATWNPRRVHR